MRVRRDELLQALPDAQVTSRWIDIADDAFPHYGSESLNSDPGMYAENARHDMEDVFEADTLLAFTGGGGKGGRHVEFGLAIAQRKRLIVVGPREHVFHTLPQVVQFDSFADFLQAETAS